MTHMLRVIISHTTVEVMCVNKFRSTDVVLTTVFKVNLVPPSRRE